VPTASRHFPRLLARAAALLLLPASTPITRAQAQPQPAASPEIKVTRAETPDQYLFRITVSGTDPKIPDLPILMKKSGDTRVVAARMAPPHMELAFQFGETAIGFRQYLLSNNVWMLRRQALVCPLSADLSAHLARVEILNGPRFQVTFGTFPITPATPAIKWEDDLLSRRGKPLLETDLTETWLLADDGNARLEGKPFKPGRPDKLSNTNPEAPKPGPLQTKPVR